ncbi:xanthine dehydrogenase family protein molybdopterin-binding subunit [Mucilaginibacter segetis]|uniref:Xanthine dehydrogenase family protein molybdopterin-binding subunit n=1 Tax=Mucilaginibacter segetis TaxID=2793071 RepID=A0A934PTC8_9SPHI|nr:molybdopterin cofactor-binding domain-containing protein [Mucilaginibacter segetis]MBK0380463.1 xanthine dehydrogenase family protein molybdopterin-binding subunit [Mucilaginibacter segetis]
MQDISRRYFIKSTSTLGVALWLGLSAKGDTVKSLDPAIAENFSPFILVEPNGNITIFNNKPEIGQGTFQSIPALIAEEFEVSLDHITIKLTNGEKQFGRQSAGGSSSIRGSYTQLRKVGAAAREVFIKAAANRWQTDATNCYAEAGEVINRTTKASFTYGELVGDAAKLDLPKDPQLKDPKDFKILGKPAHRPDIPLKTNGDAVFGIDVQLPGMLYATVERCPVLGGTLKSFNAGEALKMPGVVKIAEVERVIGRYSSVGVAVIADSYWNAMQARKKLKVDWDTRGYETFNSSAYDEKLRSMANEPGLLDKKKGDVDSLTLKPENIIEAFYETPQIAHHPLEPLNCVAQVNGDKVEIWTSTQVPSSITGGQIDGFKPENVKLNATFVGGGFGRRLSVDYVNEAVSVAKQINKPVKVIWSREDTTQQGTFRPMTFSQLKGGFAENGELVQFEHKVISPSYSEANRKDFNIAKVDGTMVEGIGEQAYEIPNIKTSYVRADYHVPLGAWRSVTSSTLAFAQECFIDELANKAKMDPMEFRISLLHKPSDTKKVLLKLKELSGWDTPLPKGRGRGVAVWEFFAGLCAQVVEVTYSKDRSVKVDKAIVVIDLGEMVNPDNVANQVEGAIIMALGAATKPGITLKNGVVAEHNFYDNPLVRIYEAPKIEVHILTDGGKIKGVGEPGLPPFAPALANAIFAVTGKRIRKMPFDLQYI